MNKDIKVAIDLDGVIWDLVKPWVERYNIIYNDNIQLNDIKVYNLSKSLTKASYNEIRNILLEDNFWESVVPFPYSVEYLKKLNDEFKVYIATKTDFKLFERKVYRFLKLFPYMKKDQIICIYNKSLLDVDWLIDDCSDNLKNGKFNKIVLDASYNKDCNFIRANDLKEVYEIIKNYEE